MNLIGVTMRVDHYEAITEHRDAIDQRWYTFLVSCGLTPILIPNHIPLANDILNNIELKGVLLTGGNDLVPLGETPSDRDNLENHLLKWSMNEHIPILGVCRGMQLILRHFNNPIVPVENHVKVQHRIHILDKSRMVNSYHDYGCKEIISENIKVLALSEDNVIECIEHHHYPIKGIMWHPERNEPFDEDDILLFRDHFKPNQSRRRDS